MKNFNDWLSGYLEGRGVEKIEELDAKGVAAVVNKLNELHLTNTWNRGPTYEFNPYTPIGPVKFTNFDEVFKKWL